jgi:hypothetical protein
MVRSVLLNAGLFAALTPVALAQDVDLDNVPIVVSPSTINLESEGVWVTVHAEIPAAIVDGLTVTLDGIQRLSVRCWPSQVPLGKRDLLCPQSQLPRGAH